MPFFAFLAVAALFAGVVCDPNVVQTKSGPVEGYLEDGVRIWRGIPFAASPTGNNRFRPPQPVTPWTSVKKCHVQGDICPQLHTGTPLVLGSEDCLYLDVYVPERVTPANPTAVMIWLFGGGFVFGDGWEFGLYDGKNLARKHNVIIVGVNYRLSALGFMALDGLRNESGTSGNYGTQDQRAAMEWVDQNIAAFGGDLSRRLIFGESAGAFSVCYHLVSPASRGLFQAAIMESGTCDSPLFFRPWSEATAYSVGMAKGAGCPNDANLVKCLRDLKADKILNAELSPDAPFRPKLYPVMPWAVAIDGSANGLLSLPLTSMRNGQWARVPLIIGTNRNEGTDLLPMMPIVDSGVKLPLDEKSAAALLLHFYNQSTSELIARYYPMDQYKDYDAMATSMLRDFFFQCPTRRALRAVTQSGVPGWMYRFTYRNDDPIYPIFGDAHAAELKYVFDNPFPKTIPFSQRDEEMAGQFGFYWTNMAKTRNPNGPSGANYPTGALPWPAYNQSANLNVVLDVPSSLQANLDGTLCDFWDTVS